MQIWNLCIALFTFACIFTFVALRRPRGPQPAAYGHLQTLANLVDEWSPVMWWGHKEDGIPYCHAGRYLCAHDDTALTLLQRDEWSPAAEREDGLHLCWFRCWVSGSLLVRGTCFAFFKGYLLISLFKQKSYIHVRPTMHSRYTQPAMPLNEILSFSPVLLLYSEWDST
jgi:hypothetical protein